MAKNSKATQEKVHETMKEFEQGTLKSGSGGKKVASRKQAAAIGLSEARQKGYKAPDHRSM